VRIDKHYLDTKLSFEERAAILVGNMTLREKIAQTLQAAPPIQRLGIPAYTWWNECLHGVGRSGLATVFPQAIGRAATFDAALEKRVATAISMEARAKYNQYQRKGFTGIYGGITFWTPNINIFRDPRWGRGQETFGEDPYLTSRMGVAFVKGLQGDDPRHLRAAACAKHYAVHSGPEHERHQFDARVNGRDLRETYLPAFEALVREAGVESVMTAYNRVNGEACSASETLLVRILRGEWGFRGHVVSDSGAVENIHEHHKITATPEAASAMAVKAGCDLCCGNIYINLLSAVQQGLVTEAEITTCVERLFTTRMRLGMFDPPGLCAHSKLDDRSVATRRHRALALESAERSLVLLKNNGVLPLDRNKIKSIGVCGPLSLDATALLGNYAGFPRDVSTLLTGLVDAAGGGVNIPYIKGCDLVGGTPITVEGLKWWFHPCEVIVVFVGFSPEIEGEEGDGGDRTQLRLPGHQQAVIEAACQVGLPVVAVVLGGGPIDLTWAHEHCDAVVMAWYPGEAGGRAVGRALFGDTNPSGRLPVTFPKRLEDVPDFRDYSMKGRTYRYAEIEPLYRFGYGLSYTKFVYNNLKIGKPDKQGRVRVTVRVRNAGRRDGDEVVQLYVKDVEASVPVPRHHLEGFTRIHLAAGKSRDVSFTLKRDQFACRADDGTAFIEPGEFRIFVGGGQPDDPAAGGVSGTCVQKE
jgi:beta-glucosidase